MMVPIPRVLYDRDPHNYKHVKAAVELLAMLAELQATERTVAELARVGVTLPKTIKVKPTGTHDAVIGAFFFLDRGLIVSDNVIVPCATCHAALQIRPASNISAPKLCAFCAVDRLLKDYWAEHDAAGTPTARS